MRRGTDSSSVLGVTMLSKSGERSRGEKQAPLQDKVTVKMMIVVFVGGCPIFKVKMEEGTSLNAVEAPWVLVIYPYVQACARRSCPESEVQFFGKAVAPD